MLPTERLRLGEAATATIELGPHASKFFKSDRVGWDLSLPGEPELERLNSWLERECASAVAGLEGNEYSSLLGVFGHHVGTLFKTSGAMTIWSQPDTGYDPTRRVLDKLLPIWGVSQAISLHKKQGEKGWKELLRDWVDPKLAKSDTLPEQVRRSILSLCLYVYAHGVGRTALSALGYSSARWRTGPLGLGYRGNGGGRSARRTDREGDHHGGKSS